MKKLKGRAYLPQRKNKKGFGQKRVKYFAMGMNSDRSEGEFDTNLSKAGVPDLLLFDPRAEPDKERKAPLATSGLVIDPTLTILHIRK